MSATASRGARRGVGTIAEIVALYEDAERCAAAAGLRYVAPEEAGLLRRRRTATCWPLARTSVAASSTSTTSGGASSATC